MSVYVVDYDLRNPDHDYQPLYDALNQYECCHALESSWFIDSDLSASAIRDDLCQHVHQQDQIYVMRLRPSWSSCRTESCSRWLHDQSRNW